MTGWRELTYPRIVRCETNGEGSLTPGKPYVAERLIAGSEPLWDMVDVVDDRGVMAQYYCTRFRDVKQPLKPRDTPERRDHYGADPLSGAY